MLREGKNTYKNRNICVFQVLIFLLVLTSQSIVAQEPTDLISFDIPQQTAELSLTIFAEQADRTLVFPYDKVKGRITNRLVGEFTFEDAINRLLEGVSLFSSFSDDGLLTIKIEENEMNLRQKSGFMASLLAVLGASTEMAVAQESDAEDAINKKYFFNVIGYKCIANVIV